MRNATPLKPKTRTSPMRRTSAETSRWFTHRDTWMRRISATSHFQALFDSLPGLHFFAKDRQGKLMFLSRSIRERYGMTEESQFIGLTDFDINPDGMAASYVSDDEYIYKTGEPIMNRIELWWDPQGIPDWYVCTKMPIRSQRGAIIGIMGVLHAYEGRSRLMAPWREIEAAVRHIRENFRDTISIEQLAKLSNLSTRQLQRKFRLVLGVRPKEFLIKTRVLAACHSLRESDAPLAVIAADCGFYDQSSFTQHFRRHVGQTPRKFRRIAAERGERLASSAETPALTAS